MYLHKVITLELVHNLIRGYTGQRKKLGNVGIFSKFKAEKVQIIVI